jgi:hypothetical protein
VEHRFKIVEDSGDFLIALYSGDKDNPAFDAKDKDWRSLGRPLKFGSRQALPFKTEAEARDYFTKNRDTMLDLAARAGALNPTGP